MPQPWAILPVVLCQSASLAQRQVPLQQVSRGGGEQGLFNRGAFGMHTAPVQEVLTGTGMYTGGRRGGVRDKGHKGPQDQYSYAEMCDRSNRTDA